MPFELGVDAPADGAEKGEALVSVVPLLLYYAHPPAKDLPMRRKAGATRP